MTSLTFLSASIEVEALISTIVSIINKALGKFFIFYICIEVNLYLNFIIILVY